MDVKDGLKELERQVAEGLAPPHRAGAILGLVDYIESIPDPGERQRLFDDLLAESGVGGAQPGPA